MTDIERFVQQVKRQQACFLVSLLSIIGSQALKACFGSHVYVKEFLIVSPSFVFHPAALFSLADIIRLSSNAGLFIENLVSPFDQAARF
eukprot:603850-Pelagomonas_calceolata.AAC.2